MVVVVAGWRQMIKSAMMIHFNLALQNSSNALRRPSRVSPDVWRGRGVKSGASGRANRFATIQHILLASRSSLLAPRFGWPGSSAAGSTTPMECSLRRWEEGLRPFLLRPAKLPF